MFLPAFSSAALTDLMWCHVVDFVSPPRSHAHLSRRSYNLGQNGWKIKTTPPPNDGKMARFLCSSSASLNWGEGYSYFSFYSVQDCSLASNTKFKARLSSFTQAIFLAATRCNFCRAKIASSFKHARNSCDIAATNNTKNRTWFTRAILKLQPWARQKLHRVAATKIGCVNGPLGLGEFSVKRM